MPFAKRVSLTLVTSSSGAATGYIGPVTGRVSTFIYTKVDYAAGVDFTITAEATGQSIWAETDCNASKTVAPRQPVHTQAGAAAGAAVLEPIVLADDRIKIVIAQGGDAKSGQFTVLVE